MKIGFFTDSYKPYMSGVVKSIESFTEQLEKRGHKVYIFAPDYPGADDREDIFRFKSVPSLTNPGFRLAIPLSSSVISEVKELGLDIIHTHSPFLMGGLGKVIARRLDLPLVFTYHTLYEEYAHYAPFGQGIARKLAVKYSRNYCQACDLVIAPSGYVKSLLRGYNITTPIVLLPTGVDLEPYRQRSGYRVRKEYGISEAENLILFVGRLGKEKNINFLLDAYREVTDNMSDSRLLLVGDGPLRNMLEAKRDQYRLTDRVIFTGQVAPERVVDFYLASDLFAFPSRTETQGLVTLEAMAGGLPVVAVKAAGSSYMVDHGVNGILVEEDIYLFARKIVEILTHQKRYHFFRQNAQKKAEEYSIENMTEKLITAYRNLVKDQSKYRVSI